MPTNLRHVMRFGVVFAGLALAVALWSLTTSDAGTSELPPEVPEILANNEVSNAYRALDACLVANGAERAVAADGEVTLSDPTGKAASACRSVESAALRTQSTPDAHEAVVRGMAMQKLIHACLAERGFPVNEGVHGTTPEEQAAFVTAFVECRAAVDPNAPNTVPTPAG
jgi:hypothetical protein